MALGCFHCLRAGGPDSGVKEEKRGETMQQTNSIIRAFTLLEILKKESDETHKLSQKQLLALMKKKDGRCTEKTLRTDLRNLMGILNPPSSEYEARKEDFRIIYDGIEEERGRMTGIRYIHEFSNDDLELLLELLQTCTEIGGEKRRKITGNLKKLGSGHYTYNMEFIKGISEYSTMNTVWLRRTLRAAGAAIRQNRRLSFVFNKYDRNGRLVPARDDRYEVNPYYVVKYGVRYYLLASHKESEKIYIYRMDLMTDAELMEEERTSVRRIKELRHSSALEYMERHLHMNYDEPRTVVMRLHRSAYTRFHDSFGGNYTLVRAVDEEHDEVKVFCSENAIVNWAIQNSGDVEILRPESARKKIQEKAEALLQKYSKRL